MTPSHEALLLAALTLVVLICGVALLALGQSRAHAGASYRYFGTRQGQRSVRLSLNSATLVSQGSHVAAWLGASTPSASAWVQGGVADEGAGPELYIEFKRPHGLGYGLVMWHTSFGQRVRIRLVEHLNRWHVIAGGHVSRSVLLEPSSRVSTLEVLGDAHGRATIAQREVTAP